MALLERVATLVRANLNDLIDRFGFPGVLLGDRRDDGGRGVVRVGPVQAGEGPAVEGERPGQHLEQDDAEALVGRTCDSFR